MSESGDSGPGRREVAHRLFAAEFDDAEFSYSESDEERAPNYVVTPTGARVNRIFAVGVLTELEQVNEEVLRARVVDPTGPFVVYAGQYQPEALAFLEAAEPPMFVAVTGKARTFEPEDSDRVFTSIRPESISEVDAETRDRWVVQAAEQTIARVGRMASAKNTGLSGDALTSALAAAGVGESDAAGVTLALEYYGTTGDYLRAVRDLAINCARVVAGEQDEAGTLSLSPGEGTDDPIASLAPMDLDPVDAASAVGSDTAEVEATDDGGDSAPVSGDSAAAEDAVDSSDPDDETETEPVEASTTTDTEAVTPSEPTDSEPAADDATSGADADSGTLGDFDSGDDPAEPADESEDVDEFDPEFELDEDEREEIEQEYGTAFQSGTEVDDAGEAGIETPDPEELAEQEAAADAASGDSTAPATDEPTADADSPEGTDGAATESEDDTATSGDTDVEDVDLEDAVMDAMTELDDGSGADREALLETVTERYGADRAAVEEAIQDALMGGRCYEPDDDKLTPI